MGKIIKVTREYVVIAKDNANIVTFEADLLDFTPNVGDIVNIAEENNETNITLVKQSIDEGAEVRRWPYVLLAFSLGFLGGHKFYAGQKEAGYKYLIFFWTGIPILIAFYEGIKALTAKEVEPGVIKV